MTTQVIQDAKAAEAKSPAVFARPMVIKKRADFVRAANALRRGTPAFLVQARNRGDDKPYRVGFTCSKKVGNAVARNLAKRRLREIARLVINDAGQAGWDYVLIGRKDITAARDFAEMQRDLRAALRHIHK